MTQITTKKRQVEGLQKKLKDMVAHQRRIDNCLTLSNIATFMIYFAFLMSLYISSLWGLGIAFNDFSGSIAALCFFTAFALLLSFVLASVKHIGYMHASWFKLSPFALIMFISFGLAADWFTTSDTQDTKARMIAESSAEHKSILDGNGTPTAMITPPLTAEIAAAKQVYNRCVMRMQEGKEKHCRGDYGKMTSLQESQKLALESFQQNSLAKQQTDNSRLDKLKHDAHNPLIVALSSSAGIEIAQAIAVLTFWVALAFEVLHYLLSVFRRQTADALDALKESLGRTEGDYLDMSDKDRRDRHSGNYGTQKTTDTPDESEAFLLRQSERENKAKQQRESVELSPAVAKKCRSAPAVEEKQGFGFMPSQKPKATPESSYQPKISARLPQQQHADGTGNQNPNLGTHEHHFELPLDRSGEDSEGSSKNRSEPHSNGLEGYSDSNHSSVLAERSDTSNDNQNDFDFDIVETASEKLANPNNFALLKRYVSNPKFDDAFVSVATAQTKCSQSQAMKAHKIGGDFAGWLMVIMEAWEIVTAPNSTNKARKLIQQLSIDEANEALEDVKLIILNKE